MEVLHCLYLIMKNGIVDITAKLFISNLIFNVILTKRALHIVGEFTTVEVTEEYVFRVMPLTHLFREGVLIW